MEAHNSAVRNTALTFIIINEIVKRTKFLELLLIAKVGVWEGLQLPSAINIMD